MEMGDCCALHSDYFLCRTHEGDRFCLACALEILRDNAQLGTRRLGIAGLILSGAESSLEFLQDLSGLSSYFAEQMAALLGSCTDLDLLRLVGQLLEAVAAANQGRRRPNASRLFLLREDD